MAQILEQVGRIINRESDPGDENGWRKGNFTNQTWLHLDFEKLKLCLKTRSSNLLCFRDTIKLECNLSNFILLSLWSTSLLILKTRLISGLLSIIFPHTRTLLILTNQQFIHSSITTCIYNQPFIRIQLHSEIFSVNTNIEKRKKKRFSVGFFKRDVSCQRFWSGLTNSSF